MANSIASPYVDALSAQKQKMEGLVAAGVKAIAYPAQQTEMESKDKFLSASGVTLGVIGVILIIVGLIIKIDGLFWTGIISLSSGAYCYFKSIQLGRRSAFASVGNDVVGKLDGINSELASQWETFAKAQNAALTRDIIASAAANDTKAAMVDAISVAPVTVDMTDAATSIDKAAGEENISAISDAVEVYVTAANKAIDNVTAAQTAVYNAVDAANK